MLESLSLKVCPLIVTSNLKNKQDKTEKKET